MTATATADICSGIKAALNVGEDAFTNVVVVPDR
jgi:hypothetical protein